MNYKKDDNSQRVMRESRTSPWSMLDTLALLPRENDDSIVRFNSSIEAINNLSQLDNEQFFELSPSDSHQTGYYDSYRDPYVSPLSDTMRNDADASCYESDNILSDTCSTVRLFEETGNSHSVYQNGTIVPQVLMMTDHQETFPELMTPSSAADASMQYLLLEPTPDSKAFTIPQTRTDCKPQEKPGRVVKKQNGKKKVATSQNESEAEAEEAEQSCETNHTDEGLYQRFIQAFELPGTCEPKQQQSKLPMHEQLLADKLLMEELSKKPKRGSYRCTHCPELFPTIFEYAKHLDENEIEREYKCPFKLCPWKILGLLRRPDLRRHCAIQHKNEIPQELRTLLNLSETNFPILECKSRYCEKSFYRKDSYSRHVSMVHENRYSRFNRRLERAQKECPHTDEPLRTAFIKDFMNITRKKKYKVGCERHR